MKRPTVYPEKDFLHDALIQLTRSPRPLRAISEYATVMGAARGLLFEGHHLLQVVDEWAQPGAPLLGDTACDLVSSIQPDDEAESVFCPDLSLLPSADRALCASYSLGAGALLPLVITQHVIGWVMFFWNTPRDFTPHEQYMLTAITDQSAPVINMAWGLTNAQKKVLELRLSRQESEILRDASQQLSEAHNPHELLEAVSSYPRSAGAAAAALFYRQGESSLLVAQWHKHQTTFSLEAYAYEAGHDIILVDDRYDAVDTSAAVLHLNSRGKWLGTIIFYWNEPYYFNNRDRYLYRALLQQVSAAIESAQLLDELKLRAQRAEQVLTVNTALSRARDEVQILNAIAGYEAVKTAAGALLYYADLDDTGHITRQQPVAFYQDGQAAFYDSQTSVPSFMNFTLPGLCCTGSHTVILMNDFHADPRLTPEERDYILNNTPVQALALIDLFSGGAYQGWLTIVWFEQHDFTDEEKYVYEVLRQTLPSLIAMRRAYLNEEKAHRDVELRARDLATIAQISMVISSILDEAALLTEVAHITRASFPEYHVLIYLREGDWLERIPAQRGLEPDEDPILYRIPIQQQTSLMGEAFRSGQSLIVKDLENAEGYMLRPLMTGARSEMAIPLMIGQEAIGVVVVETTTVNRFTEADIQVMKTLVDLIAVAVQNARLYAQAQQFAVAEERNRLARELHDSVSQALYGIVLGANTAQALLRERQYTQLESAVDYVLALAKAGLEEIRASIFDLRPVVLEDQGLMYAVRGHLSSLQTRHHIQVESLLCDEPDVPFATKEALYRVVREALHNIVKHAQATRVVVEMTHLPQTMVIRIGDNGRGFDMARATDHSLGLKSMRERVKALDGALHIHSMPGEGTEITVHIPL